MLHRVTALLVPLLIIAGCGAPPSLVGLPDGMLYQPYSASVFGGGGGGAFVGSLNAAGFGGGTSGEVVVEGLPAGLAAAEGTISGTPEEAGLYMLTVYQGSEATGPGQSMSLRIGWDTTNPDYFAAFYMRPGEYNNKLADEDGAMIHPWVRLAGTGYHAEEAGDPATVRQMRVALYAVGPDGVPGQPWGDADGDSIADIHDDERGTYDDLFLGELTGLCTFASEDPSFTRITEDDWGEREPMDWADSEVELSPEGVLLGGPYTGRAGVQATCQGVEEPIVDWFLIIPPAWCNAPNCPGQ